MFLLTHFVTLWNFSNTHIVAHIITQDTRVVSKKFESKLSVVSVFKIRNELSIFNFLKIVVSYFDFCKEPLVTFELKMETCLIKFCMKL